MYNQMLDGNSAAELENDAPLTQAEIMKYIEEGKNWLEIRENLLAGKEEKNAFGQNFSLNVRLGEECQEFADLIDQDFDIMAAYNRGELHPSVRELIFNEANTLASVICG